MRGDIHATPQLSNLLHVTCNRKIKATLILVSIVSPALTSNNVCPESLTEVLQLLTFLVTRNTVCSRGRSK